MLVCDLAGDHEGRRQLVPVEERVDPWEKHPSARKVLLDPAGRALDSAAFAAVVREAEMRARDLVFIIGGHDGLPAGWRSRARTGRPRPHR